MSNQQSFQPERRERQGKKSRKAAKPFVVEWRAVMGNLWREWSKFGAYHSLDVAQEVVRLHSSPNGLFEYRIRPKDNGK